MARICRDAGDQNIVRHGSRVRVDVLTNIELGLHVLDHNKGFISVVRDVVYGVHRYPKFGCSACAVTIPHRQRDLTHTKLVGRRDNLHRAGAAVGVGRE
ncbi:hypothetical protein SDC9_155767 [bioreactor metagenome]|uniref:Uncharacterized protein n=1 Tax=bioreactor metagenome TaxID=1076179 RepID=A0A645F2D5_9ZZZZ